MKKLFLLIIVILLTKVSFSQIKVKDSVYVRVDKLNSNEINYQISSGKILGIDVYIKNKYENQTGYVTGYFDSNLTLKQKHKLDSSKVIAYDKYVELINKDILNVFYYYKVFFIISEAKYDYLTLQVRQIMPPDFSQE